LDSKLLEVGEGSGVEPTLQLGVEVAESEEKESAGGTRVLSDYLGDSGGKDEVGEDEALGADREVERRRAPEVAPSAGEGLRAAAVLGGEDGDDGAEDIIGKAADEIAGYMGFRRSRRSLFSIAGGWRGGEGLGFVGGRRSEVLGLWAFHLKIYPT
jgi:hypothetical protein